MYGSQNKSSNKLQGRQQNVPLERKNMLNIFEQ